MSYLHGTLEKNEKKMELEAAGYTRGLVGAEDRESVPNTKCPCMMHPPMATMM
jgi:hypothetical protein